MSILVTGGAMLQCSFGTAPSMMMVPPVNRTLSAMPVANIMDNKPFVNIMPFGMCTSMANPTVSAATSAAMGVLTPMPCVPMTTAPWIPGSPTVLIGPMPAVSNACKLMCNWGGIIQVNTPGQFTIMVP